MLLDILDTAGQEEYSVMRDQYIRTGQGFVLVYSIVVRQTFDSMVDFYDQVLRVTDTDSMPMVLLGNKCDLDTERKVSKEEGQELANNFQCLFYETSAKSRVNVDEAFYALVKRMIGGKSKSAADDTDEPVAAKKKKKGGCVLL